MSAPRCDGCQRESALIMNWGVLFLCPDCSAGNPIKYVGSEAPALTACDGETDLFLIRYCETCKHTWDGAKGEACQWCEQWESK